MLLRLFLTLLFITPALVVWADDTAKPQTGNKGYIYGTPSTTPAVASSDQKSDQRPSNLWEGIKRFNEWIEKLLW